MERMFLMNTATAAQKAKRHLNALGISAGIKRITEEGRGCRFAVTVSAEYLYKVSAELTVLGVPFEIAP